MSAHQTTRGRPPGASGNRNSLALRWRVVLTLFWGAVLLSDCAEETPSHLSLPPPPSIEPELPPREPPATLVDWKATWGPAYDRIAYLHRSVPGEPEGIYEVLLDSNYRAVSRHVILHPQLETYSMRYSPDSKHLALVMSLNVYILGVDGGDLWQVTHTNDAVGVDWCLDGRHFIYVRGTWSPDIYPAADSGNIRFVDLDAWTDRPFPYRSGRVLWGSEARMARDGRRVVFSSYNPETRGSDIFLYAPEYDRPRNVTPRGWHGTCPIWYENDSRILFQVDIPIFSPDPWYSITADGGDLTPFVRPGVVVNLGLEAAVNEDATMCVLTARDANSEDGVLWIRRFGPHGIEEAWQVTDYR